MLLKEINDHKEKFIVMILSMLIISQIYCYYIYISKERYDMENRGADDSIIDDINDESLIFVQHCTDSSYLVMSSKDL